MAGGVCYFLWNRDDSGSCEVINIVNGEQYASTRSLNEFDIFIRNGRAVSIINKVKSQNEKMMNTQVTSRKPFGLPTNERPKSHGELILRWQNGEGPYPRNEITIGNKMIDEWKVICAKTAYDHAGSPGKDGKRKVFTTIHILPPKTICTETYIVVGSFQTKEKAQNLKLYMMSSFFRFMVSQFLYSQDITRERFAFVPIQDFSESWTDEKLYKKYHLSKDEIAFIESMIRPMELTEGETI